MDDAHLIARSVTDGRFFEVLFDRHYRRIHRFCSARAGTDAADDLASETFLIAFRRRADYDLAHPDASPWLYGIALNVVRAFRRRELVRRRTANRGVFSNGSRAGSAETESPNSALSIALRGLDDRDRDLIVLFAWAELTYEQLSEALGIPVGTVRSRLSRVRSRLRRQLELELAEDRP